MGGPVCGHTPEMQAVINCPLKVSVHTFHCYVVYFGGMCAELTEADGGVEDVRTASYGCKEEFADGLLV